MTKTITVQQQSFAYQIKKSKRAKRMRITVKRNLEIVVTLPKWCSIDQGEKMVIDQTAWIQKTVTKIQKNPPLPTPAIEDWKVYKPQALIVVQNSIEKYKHIYPYTYHKITIKNSATRWGSCSRKKNLNFSYRLALLPTELAEYIVVHELCHLREMNHSARFWALVAKTFPNFTVLRQQLNYIHM